MSVVDSEVEIVGLAGNHYVLCSIFWKHSNFSFCNVCRRILFLFCSYEIFFLKL